jgi:PAS domain S-box-containing protein
MPQADPTRIQDPERLAALEETGLLDSVPEDVFDRQTRLASRLLGVPVSLVSLVAGDHQFHKSRHDATGSLPASRRDPLSASFCQHVVASAKPLMVQDSATHALVHDNEAADIVRAYLGVPLTLSSGAVLGSFCAIDFQPHEWSAADVQLLEDIAAGTASEIELRVELTRRRKLQAEMEGWLRADRLLVEVTTRFISASGPTVQDTVLGALQDVRQVFELTRATLVLEAAAEHPAGTYIHAADAGDEAGPLHHDGLPIDLKERLRGFDAVVLGGSGNANEGGWQRLLDERGTATVALVPVQRGVRLVGVVIVESAVPRHWPEHKLLLLRVLGEAVYGAIRRSAAERELRETQLRRSAILDTSLEAIVTTDAVGCIIDFNLRAESMFGVPASKAVGVSMLDLLIPPALRATLTAAMRRDGEHDAGMIGERVETRALRADGTAFPVELALAPVTLPNGQEHFIAFFRDISQRVRREEELEAVRTAANASLAAKERFLANVSHELRTPLNAVIGASYLLAETELDAGQSEYLHAVRYSANLLLALINDLLDLGRAESGRISFESVPFSVEGTVASAVNAFTYEAERRGLRLDLVLEDALPAVVEGDPVRLNQILTNLIGNALKFTPDGVVRVAVQTASVAADTVSLRFVISDTGIGIAPHRLDGVFDAFTQERSDTARLYGGTGLGLTIVRELVAAQGGKIDVDSEVGRGTTFTLEIPYSRGTARPAEPGRMDEAVDLTGVRILVAEDNEMNRLVTRAVLTAAGAEVETVNDGAEAVFLLRALPFDLVLMDLQMPGMDGYHAARQIRGELGMPSGTLPILALTASATIDERRQIEAAGMDDLILKPCEPTLLKRRIAAHINREGMAGGSARPATPGRIAAFDPVRLRDSTLGDRAFARELAEIFERTTPPLLDQLEEALTGPARGRDVAALMHRLKASAGAVGATALQHGAAALEAAAALEGAPLDAAWAHEIRELYEAARAALADHLADEVDG